VVRVWGLSGGQGGGLSGGAERWSGGVVNGGQWGERVGSRNQHLMS